MARPLHAHVVDGDAIDEELLRRLWRLRLEMLTLTRSEEQDWAEFSAACTGPEKQVFAFLDPEGEPQGFFTIRFLPVDAAGRRMLLMFSKYFYFRKAYRGHPKTYLSPWRLLGTSLRRYGARSLHFVTTAFPQSYVSLTRTSGRTWSTRDVDAPVWAREALDQFARTVAPSTYDPGAGLVRGGNVPDDEFLPRSAEAKRLYARYEELNPDWREGNALPILFSVDPRLVWFNAKRVVTRALRR